MTKKRFYKLLRADCAKVGSHNKLSEKVCRDMKGFKRTGFDPRGYQFVYNTMHGKI